MVSPDARPTTAPMSPPMDDDMIPIADAARLIGVSVSTARSWVLKGMIVGAAHHGRRGLISVPRSEVVRVRAEREERAEASKLKPSSWVPMTDRTTIHGHGPTEDEGQHA